jgi:glutamyl-tRNA synthetase
VKEATTRWLAKYNLDLKAIQQSIRVSLTGRTNSPELFQVMGLLGRETTLERLNG